jgi:hypothetical protein
VTRSDRYPVVVQVKVKWLEPSGASIIEFAEAKEVNMHGGLLDMRRRPAAGSVIELTNLISTKTASARVVSLRTSMKSEVLGVAVELLTPSETFWGLTYRLKMTTDDLLKLEEDIRSGEMDTVVLREFRDAVDYVRKGSSRIAGAPDPTTGYRHSALLAHRGACPPRHPAQQGAGFGFGLP